MLLSEESHPLEHVAGACGRLLEPGAERRILMLEPGHGRARDGRSIARTLELLHPRFGDQRTLPEARELIAKMADQLLQLVEGTDGFNLMFCVGHAVRSPVLATACPVGPLLPCHVECGRDAGTSTAMR